MARRAVMPEVTVFDEPIVNKMKEITLSIRRALYVGKFKYRQLRTNDLTHLVYCQVSAVCVFDRFDKRGAMI